MRISGRNSGSSEKNIIWADRSMASFLRDMLPLTLLSLLLLAAAVWFQGRTLLAVQTLEMPKAPDRKKLAAYGILFLVCLTCVLRLLSWPVMLAVLMLAVLLIDRSLFRSVDYFLLLTFVCFFLFIGNMERIPAVASLMRELIDGRNFRYRWGSVRSSAMCLPQFCFPALPKRYVPFYMESISAARAR